MSKRILAALAVAAAAPQAAQAGTIVQNFGTEFSSIQGFDGSLGRLDEVLVEVDSILEGNFVLPYRDEPFASAQYGGFADLNLRFIDSGNGAEALFVIAGMNFPSGNFGYNDQPSTYSYAFTTQRSVSRLRSSGTPLALQALTRFTTDNLVNIQPNAGSRLAISYTPLGGGTEVVTINAAQRYTSYLGRVTYVYSDVAGVPEPATWALLILGFGMIGAGMRRRPASAMRGEAIANGGLSQ